MQITRVCLKSRYTRICKHVWTLKFYKGNEDCWNTLSFVHTVLSCLSFFLHKSHTPTQPVIQELSHFSYLTHLLHVLLFHLTIPKAEQQRRWGNFETSGYFQNFSLAACLPSSSVVQEQALSLLPAKHQSYEECFKQTPHSLNTRTLSHCS